MIVIKGKPLAYPEANFETGQKYFWVFGLTILVDKLFWGSMFEFRYT